MRVAKDSVLGGVVICYPLSFGRLRLVATQLMHCGCQWQCRPPPLSHRPTALAVLDKCHRCVCVLGPIRTRPRTICFQCPMDTNHAHVLWSCHPTIQPPCYPIVLPSLPLILIQMQQIAGCARTCVSKLWQMSLTALPDTCRSNPSLGWMAGGEWVAILGQDTFCGSCN